MLEEVPVEGADGDVEVEAKEEPEEAAEQPDALGESSDPVRLYLKEMGNFQLLSREQEVEIAKRIEAGENEVEEEVLGSPVTLKHVYELGEAILIGEADIRDIFEDTDDANSDPDEERGPEADERQLKRLAVHVKKLKEIKSKLEQAEKRLLLRKPAARKSPARCTSRPSPKRTS